MFLRARKWKKERMKTISGKFSLESSCHLLFLESTESSVDIYVRAAHPIFSETLVKNTNSQVPFPQAETWGFALKKKKSIKLKNSPQ